MSARRIEIIRLALSYLIANLDDAVECCSDTPLENLTEHEVQLLHYSLSDPQRVRVTVSNDGIDCTSCPYGVVVEIMEDDGEGYKYASLYDHSGRLD